MNFVNNSSLDTYDVWGMYKFSQTFKSKKIPLFFLWIKLKLTATINASYKTGVPESECPLKFPDPTSLKPVISIKPFSEGNQIGLRTRFGVESEHFTIIGGNIAGFTLKGKSYWKQVWNDSIDFGGYSNTNADLQFWVAKKNGALVSNNLTVDSPLTRKLLSKVPDSPCVCVTASSKSDLDAKVGYHPTRIGLGALGVAGALNVPAAVTAATPFVKEIVDWVIGGGFQPLPVGGGG